jgi:hypothetical protein
MIVVVADVSSDGRWVGKYMSRSDAQVRAHSTRVSEIVETKLSRVVMMRYAAIKYQTLLLSYRVEVRSE